MRRLPALKIRYKLLLFMVGLLIAALISYSALATKLFNADKSAYIYETNALLVETLSTEIETSFSSTIKTLDQLGAALIHAQNNKSQEELVRSIFQSDTNLVEVSIYEWDERINKLVSLKKKLNMYKAGYLKSYNLDKNYFGQIKKETSIPVQNILESGLAFQDSTLPGGAPVISVFKPRQIKGSPKKWLIVGNIRQDQLLKLFSTSEVYTTYLLDEAGRVLARSQDEESKIEPVNFISEILGSKFAKGAQEFTDDEGNQYIGAYSNVDLGNLVLFSYISKDKAFLAAKQLVEKTVFFGLAILFASIIFSILFSRQLTSALNKLYLATQKIAKGEFDLKVNIKSRDEVGALSKAFDKMAEEIQRLLVETHEKAQIEKEIETAKTVQDNLFPHKKYTAENFELSGYYAPAEQCGGDWWGYIPLKDKLVVLIGDATGHGVPSALVTAAAQSCCTTLRQLGEQYGEVLLSPKQIMESLNTAIYHAAKGSIKMTFFVSVMDLQSGELRYTNASHEMPMISQVVGGKRSKKHVTALVGTPGPALGDKPNTAYTEHHFQLQSGDVILWYTDGVTECRNAQREEWGERGLLRTLIKCAHQDVDDIKKALVDEANHFCDSQTTEDDITLVVGKVNENFHFTQSINS